MMVIVCGGRGARKEKGPSGFLVGGPNKPGREGRPKEARLSRECSLRSERESEPLDYHSLLLPQGRTLDGQERISSAAGEGQGLIALRAHTHTSLDEGEASARPGCRHLGLDCSRTHTPRMQIPSVGKRGSRQAKGRQVPHRRVPCIRVARAAMAARPPCKQLGSVHCPTRLVPLSARRAGPTETAVLIGFSAPMKGGNGRERSRHAGLCRVTCSLFCGAPGYSLATTRWEIGACADKSD